MAVSLVLGELVCVEHCIVTTLSVCVHTCILSGLHCVLASFVSVLLVCVSLYPCSFHSHMNVCVQKSLVTVVVVLVVAFTFLGLLVVSSYLLALPGVCGGAHSCFFLRSIASSCFSQRVYVNSN